MTAPLELPKLVLGTMTFGDTVDISGAGSMLDAALGAGISHIDTANGYAGGESERMLAKLLHGRRDSVTLATKAGMPHPDAGDNSPLSTEGLRASVEGSLRRLDTDYVDLFYLHQPDRTVTLTETLTTVAELVAEGNFSAIKIRLGRAKIADDLKSLELVRGAIGNDIQLMCDFNQGQTIQEAIWRMHALDDQGLYWFEEPVVFDNYAQSAQLAAELKTPVSIGENIYGPRSFYDAVQAKAADLYMPDLMRIGGVTGWMRAAAIAGAAGLPLSSHLYPEVSAHLLRASESADWLEYRDWGNPIIAEPFEVIDGHAIVPDRPGNGIEWNEDAVAKYAY